MALRRSFIIVQAAVMAVATLVSSSSGEKYMVGGDDSYWTIPPTPDYYANWSSSYFFKIGDSLYFDYESDRYNVIEVSKQEYESCTALNPFIVFAISPAIFPLVHQGTFYFISNISNYCNLGLKVSITVHTCSEKSNPPPPPLIHFSPFSPPGSVAPSPGGGSEAPTSTVISPAPSPFVNGFSPHAGDPAVKSMALNLRLRFDVDSMNVQLVSLIIQFCFMISVVLV